MRRARPRDARIFGKTDADMDRMIKERKVSIEFMVVYSGFRPRGARTTV